MGELWAGLAPLHGLIWQRPMVVLAHDRAAGENDALVE